MSLENYLTNGPNGFKGFAKHDELKGRHAIIGASKHGWTKYDLDNYDELYSRYRSNYATSIGTALHYLAANYIVDGFKLRKGDIRIVIKDIKRETEYGNIPKVPLHLYDLNNTFPNMANFVNDAIGYGMIAEQPIKPFVDSENAFGTADAIIFRDGMLRIHDLKTGVIPANIEQLHIYTAFFCLEHGVRPSDITMEERIYQNNEILVYNPTAEDIVPLMDKVTILDKWYTKFKKEG